MKIEVEKRGKYLYFEHQELEKNNIMRYNLQERQMEKPPYSKRDKEAGNWRVVKQQYKFFYNVGMNDIEFKNPKFNKMLWWARKITNGESISTYISKLGEVMKLEGFAYFGVEPEIITNRGYGWHTSSRITSWKTLLHPVGDYDKNVIKILGKYGCKVTCAFEKEYFESEEYQSHVESILTKIDKIEGSDDDKREFIEMFITNSRRRYRTDYFGELVKDYHYDAGSLASFMIGYLAPFEGLDIYEGMRLLHDYNRMSNLIDRKPQKYPKYLKSMHDIITKNYDSYKKEYNEELFKKTAEQYSDKVGGIEYVNGKYAVVMPETTKDIIQEGTSLNHCVSSYVDRIIEGRCFIAFMRDKKNTDESLVTIELKNGAIIQAKGAYNRKLHEEEMDFINEYAKKKELVVSTTL